MLKNHQAADSSVDSEFLEVHSIFRTIQGEGPFSGTPATFIRLAGCNLQCPMCDTDYTSIRRKRKVFSTLDKETSILEEVSILKEIKGIAPIGLVVITGGEPFRQNLNYLLGGLIQSGYYVQIETNGTLKVPGHLKSRFSLNTQKRQGCYLVCSPKTGKIHPSVLEVACCLKYVLSGDPGEDGLPLNALEHPAHPMLARPPKGWGGTICLQPADEGCPSKNRRNIQKVIASCLKNGYILQLQIHKYLSVP